MVVAAVVDAIGFRSDLRNVVDLLERDSADHLLARRLCALLHSRLRSKAVSRRMAAARNVEGGWQAAAGSQAVRQLSQSPATKTACGAKIAAGPLKK